MRRIVIHNHIPFTDSVNDTKIDNGISSDSLKAFRKAVAVDPLGYLKGLPRVVKKPDVDQWNASYSFDFDKITIHEKFEKKTFFDKVQTFLHEAGHRGQVVDKKTFTRFNDLGLGSAKNFYAMANDVHRKDYRANGIENPDEEAFAESYARFALKMPMPKAIREFWNERAAR